MTHQYWEEELETLQRKKLLQLQVERLRETVRRAARSDFYKKQLEKSGVTPDGIRFVEDIRKLPFTSKQDLRDNFPYGLLSTPKKECIRLHSSSGTTGTPTVIFHNRNDIDAWANLMARSLFCAGVRDDDVFQNMSGYGLFTGGLGFQYGIEKLGALSIPAGAGNSVRQIKLMRDYGTTAAHAIPSYLGHLYEVFESEGLDPKKDTRLKIIAIGAEPHTEDTRGRIESMYGVKAYNSFGLSEMNGPGAAFECEYQKGLHVWEDSYIVEIVDPKTLDPVPDGETGELVMTTLNREAMPILRYRTRDLTRILPIDCPCGRTHRMLDRITGRTDDMFIVKGCNIFPMQIEAVLMKIPEVGGEYRIHLETADNNDKIIIEAELKKGSFRGDLPALNELTRRIAHNIRDEILVRPTVRLVENGSLPKSKGGKAVRLFDNRIK